MSAPILRCWDIYNSRGLVDAFIFASVSASPPSSTFQELQRAFGRVFSLKGNPKSASPAPGDDPTPLLAPSIDVCSQRTS